MNEKIWLSSPHMGGTEQKYVNEAFDTNWVAPLGPNVNGFEKDLETYLGHDSHVACVTTGTAAIHLALIIAGVERGDDVLCQTFTFCGSANPIAYVGATPVFIDSEEDTWNMSPELLEEAILSGIANGKKPKAVLAVHLYGMPARIAEIETICKKHGVFLIEDAAEALGSTYKGKKCGTFGDLSILSFNGNKIITTSGGGALVCRDAETKSRAIFLATQARDEAPHYQHSEIGHNYRMSNIVAGIGRGQMEVLDAHVALRQKNNDFYKEVFSTIEEVSIFEEPNSDFISNHWLSAITFNSENMNRNREKLRIFLLNLNIESRPLWKPMHMQPVFSGAKTFGGTVSESLFERGLCLPSGSNLTTSQKSSIEKAIKNYFS